MSGLVKKVWNGLLPLEVRLAPAECRRYDQADPYLISVPRISYLALLLPRLHRFFRSVLIADPNSTPPYDGYFSYESVPLRSHLPVGLLYDIYALSSVASDAAPPLPFKITLNFQDGSKFNMISAEPPVLHDAFINSVKEADFLRSGTAKPIMSLSAADSKALWTAVQTHDLSTYRPIYLSLLPQTFRNIPLRIYLPSGPNGDHAGIKMVQTSVAPMTSPTSFTGRNDPTRQTLGSALLAIMPKLFPSPKAGGLARAILHGAPVPLESPLEELARYAAYADGWLAIVVLLNA